MFNLIRYLRGRPFVKNRRSLARVRREMDRLIRSVEDLQMRLHETPPGRRHEAAELEALYEELQRIDIAYARQGDGLVRVRAALDVWASFASPGEMPGRDEPEPLRYSDGQQPASPYSDDGPVTEPTPVTVEEVIRDRRPGQTKGPAEASRLAAEALRKGERSRGASRSESSPSQRREQ